MSRFFSARGIVGTPKAISLWVHWDYSSVECHRAAGPPALTDSQQRELNVPLPARRRA
jgi:hypothetical protein